MKKTQCQYSSTLAMLIVLFVLMVLYFVFRNGKMREYRDSLRERINEKERSVNYLRQELDRLMALKSKLVCDAIRLYRLIKLSAVLILILIGVISYVAFHFGVYESVTIIISASGLVYYTITILIQNKIGDFNRTLELIQESFIERIYRKNGFEPILIEIVERKLSNELMELNELKERHLCLAE